MKIKMYVKDKMVAILVWLGCMLMCTGLLVAFRVQSSCIIATLFLLALAFGSVLVLDYCKRRRFYRDFLRKLEGLDQKYLITEMVTEPEFAEGQILCQSLYEIDKSMQEKINALKKNNEDFQEYLELWIHEIKLPLSALTLMNYNGNENPEKEKLLIRKIEQYVEQILFLARADAAGKDYLLKKVRLEECVNKALVANKELLIESKMSVTKGQLQQEVVTDAKWLEFILGQILSNSVKYAKETDRKIKFDALVQEKKTILVVEDHGIGIAESDLPRVFDKTFTGANGRKIAASTGMGLYICKKLCEKMGHELRIESKENEYTRVLIGFGRNNYYQMEK